MILSCCIFGSHWLFRICNNKWRVGRNSSTLFTLLISFDVIPKVSSIRNPESKISDTVQLNKQKEKNLNQNMSMNLKVNILTIKVGLTLTSIRLRIISRLENQNFTRNVFNIMFKYSQRHKIQYCLFQLVPIKNNKTKLYLHAPAFKYQQSENISCCFSSISSAIFLLNQSKA